jgi:hypothetical protein
VPVDECRVGREHGRRGLPAGRGVGAVVVQRTQRAEQLRRVQGVLVDGTRIDAELGGDLQVVHQRGPTGEAVPPGHGQLRVVQGEPGRCLFRCERRSGVVPLDQGDRLGVGGDDPALQATGIDLEPVQ